MMYQPHVRPGALFAPIPQPRPSARRLMHAIAILIDGVIDLSPERYDASLKHSMLLHQASLLIVGTGCCRPLMLREAADLSLGLQCDVLVARSAEAISTMSFDVQLVGSPAPLTGLRLWKDDPSQSAWLVPSAGKGDCIRLACDGLERVAGAPFTDEISRWRGITLGNEFLATIVKGWL